MFANKRNMHVLYTSHQYMKSFITSNQFVSEIFRKAFVIFTGETPEAGIQRICQNYG